MPLLSESLDRLGLTGLANYFCASYLSGCTIGWQGPAVDPDPLLPLAKEEEEGGGSTARRKGVRYGSSLALALAVDRRRCHGDERGFKKELAGRRWRLTTTTAGPDAAAVSVPVSVAATHDGMTFLGQSSPPYPKRLVCDPTSPTNEPVSSPQYITACRLREVGGETAAAAAAGGGGGGGGGGFGAERASSFLVSLARVEQHPYLCAAIVMVDAETGLGRD